MVCVKKKKEEVSPQVPINQKLKVTKGNKKRER